MNTFGDTKSKVSRGSILGLFDDDFEKESSLAVRATSVATSFAKDLLSGTYEAAADLTQTITTTENKTATKGNGKFSMDGSIDNFNKNKAQIENLQKEKADREKVEKKKVFFQALKEDQDRAQRAREKMLFEEEISDIVTNLPTEQKNRLLHYQASYQERSIYQRAELRKKIIEERKQTEKQDQEASLAQATAKGKTAMQGMFEGGSGSQGGGQANLSFQAVG